ncbi:MAG: transcription antitermination factor NusB [Bacteroidaceae bacterium]|nr:transcription antitermination factor NusB [Bacteroidaceae bacterium]MBQ2459826.1 transcription antitermination factor NusB [Bacteroidaceae bacterium]MBQ3957746.1 transcription antitermination factor NusB [Bacteroidaceae bacterium]
MINRELIRQKAVQITYSYYQNGDGNPDTAERELLFSLSKAYDLYNSMLLLMVDLSRIATRTLEMRQNRLRRLGDYTTLSRRFVDNKFMLQLESNKQLKEFRENMKRNWADEEEFLRSLLAKVEDADFFKEYMSRKESGYAEDREVWRMIYRHFICNNEDLDAILEDMNIYWNDDKVVVDTFVLKTINRFSEESNDSQPLLPEYKDEEDREFAVRLLRRTLANESYLQNLISNSTRRWDVNRVALMDRVILQVALAEIISFPSIPISVTINEYVEMSKMYSTPNSSKYINATLDAISKKLVEEKRIVKSM